MTKLLQEDNPYTDIENKFADSLMSVRRNRNNPQFIGSKLISARSGLSDNTPDNSYSGE